MGVQGSPSCPVSVFGRDAGSPPSLVCRDATLLTARRSAGTSRSWSPRTRSRSPEHSGLADQPWPSPSFMSMPGRRSGVRSGPPPRRRRRPDAARRCPSHRCRAAPCTPAAARCRCGESARHSRPPATRAATVRVNSGPRGSPGWRSRGWRYPRRSGRPTCSRSATTRSRGCPPRGNCEIESEASRRSNVSLLSAPRDVPLDSGLPCS